MRTFDEALTYCISSNTLEEAPDGRRTIGEDKIRLQQSFQEDVANSKAVAIAIHMFKAMLPNMLDPEMSGQEQFDFAISTAYTNGMMLGVAVGVLMEKAE